MPRCFCFVSECRGSIGVYLINWLHFTISPLSSYFHLFVGRLACNICERKDKWFLGTAGVIRADVPLCCHRSIWLDGRNRQTSDFTGFPAVVVRCHRLPPPCDESRLKASLLLSFMCGDLPPLPLQSVSYGIGPGSRPRLLPPRVAWNAQNKRIHRFYTAVGNTGWISKDRAVAKVFVAK